MVCDLPCTGMHAKYRELYTTAVISVKKSNSGSLNYRIPAIVPAPEPGALCLFPRHCAPTCRKQPLLNNQDIYQDYC